MACAPLFLYWSLCLLSSYRAHDGVDAWVSYLGPNVAYPYAWLHCAIVVLSLSVLLVRGLDFTSAHDRFESVAVILCVGFTIVHTNMVYGLTTRTLYQSLMTQLGQPLFLGVYTIGLGASAVCIYERINALLRNHLSGRVVALVLAGTMYVLSINSVAHFARGETFFFKTTVGVSS